MISPYTTLFRSRHSDHLSLWLQFFWQFQELFTDILQVIFDQLAAISFHCVISPATFSVFGAYWFWVTPYLQTIASNADALTRNIGRCSGGNAGKQYGNTCCGVKA